MMFPVVLALASQALPAPPAPVVPRPDAHTGAMIAIFDSLCLRTFPDDAKAAATLDKAGWTPLSPDEVKLYLRDDPGRGWRSPRGPVSYVATIEAAPIRACALRTMTSNGVVDETRLATAIDAAKARAGGGFAAMPAFDRTIGALRMQATGAQKLAADGSAEAFYLIRTTPADPAARAKGATAIELRMVHQFVPAPGRQAPAAR